jgi:hypothetical protein
MCANESDKEREFALMIKYLFVLFLFFICITGVLGEDISKAQNRSKNQTKSVTLYCRKKYADYEKATFSFKYGVGDKPGSPEIRNSLNLLYGSLTLNGDSDFFQVRMGARDCSRIFDLGDKNWDDINEKTILEENQLSEELTPCDGAVRLAPPGSGKSINDDNIHVAKAIKGHLYLVHSLNIHMNIYSLFRVDELAPSDTCTISWKVIKRGREPRQ